MDCRLRQRLGRGRGKAARLFLPELRRGADLRRDDQRDLLPLLRQQHHRARAVQRRAQARLCAAFKLDKAAAVAALKKHYGGKKLLPKAFSNENHIEEVKGVYVPFWLYDGSAEVDVRCHGTKVSGYSTARENVTVTNHYDVRRAGTVRFERVPVDASSKMPDDHMDAIEPFDYKELKPFSTAYLPGFLADKYDVSVQDCADRADSRCETSAVELMEQDARGDYTSCTVESRNVTLHRGKVHYALMPVWLLSTKWNGKSFLFAMDGQTGKLVGDLPLDKGLYWKHFAAITGLCILGVMAAGLLLSL